MVREHVVLVGMPGSGKSTLGFHVSMLLGLPFIDTDNYIVTKMRKSVTSIFQAYGEDKFRQLEQQALEEVLNGIPSVVSTGGGMPCFHNNMDLITQKAISVYLKVEPSALAEYLKNDKKRPLLKDKSPEELLEYIITSMDSRKCYYEKADITINAYEGTPTELAINLVDMLNNFRK